MVLFPVVRSPLAALGLALLTVPLFSTAALGQPSPVTIKSVRLSPSPAGPVVTIEADGALPEPVQGQVDGPPRVFLDFPGVLTTARSVTQPVDVVKRVRVALHNASPPSTRVVLDLERPQSVRVDSSAKAAGRLTIQVAGAAAPPSRPDAPPPTPEILPVPPLGPTSPPSTSASPPSSTLPSSTLPSSPPPAIRPPAPPLLSGPPASVPPPPSPTPSDPSRPALPPPNRSVVTKIPEREAERYREQVGPSLERLRAMRQVLVAVDQQQPLSSVTANRTEVSTILRTLGTVRPNEVVRGTHDLLVRSASLALMALTLRDAPPGEPPSQEALRNAASAAAGALLLLDRVCMEIGCTAA